MAQVVRENVAAPGRLLPVRVDGIEIRAHQGDDLPGAGKGSADLRRLFRRDGVGLVWDTVIDLVADHLHAVQPKTRQPVQNILRAPDPKVVGANAKLHDAASLDCSTPVRDGW